MPIRKRWSDATEERIRANAPRRTGVYELRVDDEVVEIGRARNLRGTLLKRLADEPTQYRFQVVPFLASTERCHRNHVDRYLEQEGELPAWMDSRP